MESLQIIIKENIYCKGLYISTVTSIEDVSEQADNPESMGGGAWWNDNEEECVYSVKGHSVTGYLHVRRAEVCLRNEIAR